MKGLAREYDYNKLPDVPLRDFSHGISYPSEDKNWFVSVLVYDRLEYCMSLNILRWFNLKARYIDQCMSLNNEL